LVIGHYARRIGHSSQTDCRVTAPTKESRTLIDALLDEQRLVTAVDRFAQKHESAELPLQSRYYRDLLPLNTPRPGEQYAFEVDLDKCSGCKACVVACHSLNGLEPGESWRSVGLLVSDEPAAPFQQTITTACHHCIDPACLNGCPTLAYEKDPITGIVRHLDDQCIGCQYCILKCPYEVPRYSSRLGIVRKCDMCATRLAVGEAPACVQSCPSSAIRITVVDREIVRSEHTSTSNENSFLSASPNPSYTIPTTRFTSAKGLPPGIQAGDSETIRPAAPHWPLILMLVLTQAGIGALWVQVFASTPATGVASAQNFFTATLILAGLGASIFHLGRPLQAWRAFTGVRRSWLSREILAFSALSLSVLLHVAVGAFPFLFGYAQAVLVFCSLTGAAALLSSMMVYIDTPREFWRWPQTVPRFLGTTVLLGAASAAVFNFEPVFCGIIAAVAFAKFAAELTMFQHLSDRSSTALSRTAKLMVADLSKTTLLRFATLAIAGSAALFIYFFKFTPSIAASCALFAMLFSSELAERYLFFRAVAQPKMPGGLS
jgi:formate dehydrogenase iron-sulfur subunit